MLLKLKVKTYCWETLKTKFSIKPGLLHESGHFYLFFFTYNSRTSNAIQSCFIHSTCGNAEGLKPFRLD